MPTWKDLRRFLDRNGWEIYKNTDHYFYRKVLDNGETLMTKVSRGSGEIGYKLWRYILKYELGITNEEFNRNK